LYSYAAGTTTPLATYTDYGGGTANSNPVILDSRGEANVWFGTDQYKLKLTDADDVEIYTVDNLNGPDAATLAALAASSGSSLIGYINSGSGAVARTVQDRLREKVSVKDFGAVGNGVANDTTAIQNAINTAAARGNGGATVFFPAGTYRINTGITFTTGIILEGDSEKGTILKYYGSGSAIASTAPLTRTYYMGVTRMTIENTGTTGLIGLDLSGVNRSEFTQLQIKDFPTSVKITSPQISAGPPPTYAYALYNRFFNVLCEGETTKGFHLAGISTNAHTFNSCQFNTSETAGGAVGWYMENSNGNQIMSCHADLGAGGSKFAVIYAAAGAGASDGNVFWGNRIESFYAPNETYGFVLFENVRHTVIGGNYYVSITYPFEDRGLGTVMLDPSWTVPGISGYFPTTTSPTGQIVYKRDQSGQTFYPFMVLDDSQSGFGTPTTLQLITQRGTGYSLQVLRQGNNASISNITQANPCVITTTASHGITVGSRIALSSIGGMSQLNNTVQTVSSVTSTTLTLGSVNSTSYSAYTSGGTIVPQVTQFAVGGDGMIVQQNVFNSASSPTQNALYIGQLYVDTNSNGGYISYRTGFGAGDWKIIT
jgi:hypothetical protein